MRLEPELVRNLNPTEHQPAIWGEAMGIDALPD
jgi:hypothetical protein